MGRQDGKLVSVTVHRWTSPYVHGIEFPEADTVNYAAVSLGNSVSAMLFLMEATPCTVLR